MYKEMLNCSQNWFELKVFFLFFKCVCFFCFVAEPIGIAVFLSHIWAGTWGQDMHTSYSVAKILYVPKFLNCFVCGCGERMNWFVSKKKMFLHSVQFLVLVLLFNYVQVFGISAFKWYSFDKDKWWENTLTL